MANAPVWSANLLKAVSEAGRKYIIVRFTSDLGGLDEANLPVRALNKTAIRQAAVEYIASTLNTPPDDEKVELGPINLAAPTPPDPSPTDALKIALVRDARLYQSAVRNSAFVEVGDVDAKLAKVTTSFQEVVAHPDLGLDVALGLI